MNNKDIYTLVLTHDVDEIALKHFSFFSKNTFSFFKHCLWTNLLRLFKKDIPLSAYTDSLKWCLAYPFIKIGVIKDPWEKAIDDILAIEESYGVRSTFFFVPFAHKPGFRSENNPAPSGRRVVYDIKDYNKLINKLNSGGWEIGVHGINAHISVTEAREELWALSQFLPTDQKIGLRMHWLYQSEGLWKNLKDAGYYYDATFGDNDFAGFPEGHYYPFKKDGVWILPLNIQDVALLRNDHKGLNIKEAWKYIEKILEEAETKHAVVTVLWHTNTFGVYRYWGDLYEKILQKAVKDKAKILRCIDIREIMDKNEL